MRIFYGPQFGLEVRRGPGPPGPPPLDLPQCSTIYRIEKSKPFVSAFDSLRPSSVLEGKGKKQAETALGRGDWGEGIDWLASLGLCLSFHNGGEGHG